MSQNNGFKQGRDKTGGRKKGTPNRTTKETREALNRLVSLSIDGLKKHIKSMSPKDKLELIIKLAPYTLVKKSEQGMLGDFI